MSFFKKIFSDKKQAQQQQNAASPPTGMQAMGANMQLKFSKGIQYNMKIIIKGDRNVGKSCLFHRLQGERFKEEYIPTEEIQVTSIHWNYKATDDVVKVEVWDVVDKGKKKKKVDGLKLSNSTEDFEPCLDAEFVDVYKGTHGIVLMLDITKQWTFDYVERELPLIPPDIPVMVLANHKDMDHHRTVLEDKIKYLIEDVSANRPAGCAFIKYAESSMRNGFGLKFLHKFFNLPFLQLQRETLMKQIETNANDIEATLEELEILSESDEQNYDLFIDHLNSKRREKQETLTRQTTDGVITPSPTQCEVKANGLPPLATSKSSPELTTAAHSQLTHDISQQAHDTSQPSQDAQKPTQQTAKVEKSGFMSKFFNKKKDTPKKEAVGNAMPTTEGPAVKNVDEFIPDEGMDASFLDEGKIEEPTDKATDSDDDDEEDGGNPMVAGFQDDLDSEDDMPGLAPKLTSIASDFDLSSDEDVSANAIVKKQPKTISLNINRKEMGQLQYEKDGGGFNDGKKCQITEENDNKDETKDESSTEIPSIAVDEVDHLEDMAVDNTKSDPQEDPSVETFKMKHNSSTGSSDEDHHTVTLLADEDYSDGDDGPFDVERVEEQEAKENLEEAQKSIIALDFNLDDLDYLERRSSSLTSPDKRSTSLTLPLDTTEVPPQPVASKKMKKPREKSEKVSDSGERKEKKSKHKKHADKNTEDKDQKKKKKSKKSKTYETSEEPNKTKKKEISELEAFLGDGAGYESL